ncbi:MAG: AAA family ATPase [Rhodothermales bacterium]|nr:AAA family ATPase [Rhodothermales bacterium]
MIKRTGRKLHRLTESVAHARRIIATSCLLGISLAVLIIIIQGPHYTASTVLRVQDSTDVDVDGILELVDEGEIAAAVLTKLDVTDERLASVFNDNPFHTRNVDPVGNIVRQLNIAVDGDSVVVTYTSTTSYEARHISHIAAEAVQSQFPEDGESASPEFVNTLAALIDQREQIVNSWSVDSGGKPNVVVTAQIEMETLKQLRDRLLQNLSTSSILEIVAEPSFPLEPDRRNAPKLIAASALGFGGFACVLLLLIRAIRPTIHNQSDLDDEFDWAGELEEYGRSSSDGLDRDRLYLKPSSVLEALPERHPLADAVSFLMSLHTVPHRIVVGGADRRSGRSLVALNVATLLSKVGLRVLLIDCDIQSRRLSSMLDAATRRGFRDLVWGDTSMKEAICSTSNSSLDFLPAGRSPYGLQPVRREVNAVLEILSREYDAILIDEGGSSTTSLASASDVLVAVVAAGKSDRRAARHYLRQRAVPSCRMLLVNMVSTDNTTSSKEWVRSSRLPFRLLEEPPAESLKLVEKMPDVVLGGKLDSLLSPYRRGQTVAADEKAVS